MVGERALSVGGVAAPEVRGADIHSDAPELRPLLDSNPDLLLYTRSHPRYDDLRRIYNLALDIKPKAIVRPRDEKQVASVLVLCAERQLKVSIRSGGRDMFGRSMIQDGVVIDTTEMNTVKVSKDKTSATIGAGVMVKEVMETLGQQHLFTPVGWCDEVCYVGWAAGGGYGLYAGYYGMGVDQIIGGRVATPNGDIVDTDNDKELLWALRGCGLGNFGVITELRVKLYPQLPALAGYIAYPMTEARQVLGRFEDLCQNDLPASFSAELMIAGQDAGATITFVCHWIATESTKEEAHECLKKMRSFGTVLLDTVRDTTPYASGTEFCVPSRRAAEFCFKSIALSNFSSGSVDVLLTHPPVKGGINLVLFHQAHGKAIEPNPEAAYPFRDRHLIVGVYSVDYLDESNPELHEEVFAWPAKVYNDLRQLQTVRKGGYWSFSDSASCDVLDYYGELATERLRKLKQKYNPGDLFPQAYPVLK
ncbi:hypothetical protein V8C42DRAFT_159780 [Trichoderma barbatum]